MRALIAISHERYRENFVAYLKSLPYPTDIPPRMDFLYDGIAVLASLQKNIEAGTPYDLVIADQHLPGARGAQIIHFMRFDDASKWVPVLLFDAEAHPACVEEMNSVGIGEFMSLPMNNDDFKTLLTHMADVAVWEEEARRTSQLELLFSRRENLVENDVRDTVYLHSLQRIQQIRRVAPWSPHGRVAEGKILVGMNRFREALPILRSVVTHHFAHSEAHRLLNYCYNRLGLKYAEVSELSMLLKRNPDSPDLQLQLADAHRRRGEFREAIARYRLVLERYTRGQGRRYSAETHVGLGKSLWAEGSRTNREDLTRQATTCFQVGAKIDPTFLAAHLNLAIILRETGREEEANVVIARLREISPKSSSDWMSLFEYYLRNGDPLKARSALDQALFLDPEDQKNLLDAGLLFIRQNMYTEAIQLFDQAVVLNPSDKTLYNYVGICHRKLGRYDQAIASYDAALTVDNADAAIHFNKGRVYEAQGKNEEAIKCYEDALFFDPAMPEVADRIARLTGPKG